MKFAMISFAAAIAPTMAAEFSEVYLLNVSSKFGYLPLERRRDTLSEMQLV